MKGIFFFLLPPLKALEYGHMKSILIIEDDLSVREILKDVLLSEGYSTLEAINGQHALEVLHNCPFRPDLIILDMMMPIMDGYSFLQKWRECEPKDSSKIPIVVTSATMQKLPGGISGFIPKPFEVSVLLDVISRHLI